MRRFRLECYGEAERRKCDQAAFANEVGEVLGEEILWFHWWYVSRGIHPWPPQTMKKVEERSWHYPLPSALAIATLTIYIRSCFRVAELQGGFDGSLANDEITFMILEGAMVSIASIALTVLHPGFVVGTNWNMKKARAVLVHGRAEKIGSDHELGAVVDRKWGGGDQLTAISYHEFNSQNYK